MKKNIVNRFGSHLAALADAVSRERKPAPHHPPKPRFDPVAYDAALAVLG